MDLMIVTYKSDVPEFRHMALFLTEDGDNGTIYQVSGVSRNFEYDPREVTLSHTNKVNNKYFIKTVTNWKGRLINEQMKCVVPNNYDTYWNCQDWVLDALVLLYNSNAIDYDEYEEAKNFVENERS